jgi:hypothetical protein
MMKLVAKRTPDWYAKTLRVYLVFEKEINTARDDNESFARREETIMLIEEELAAVKGGQAIQKICLMRTVIGMLRRNADEAIRERMRSHHKSYKEGDISHEENNDESGEGDNKDGDLKSEDDWESDWTSEEEMQTELEKTVSTDWD